MSIPRIANALEYIDDDLISGAVEYKRTKKKNRLVRWGAVAACLCLMLVGLLPFANKDGASGFALTAYALDANDRVISSEMVEGESVPISFFESEKGIKCFFFSYPFIKSETNNVPSKSIIGMGTFENCSEDEVIQIVVDNCMDTDKNYVVFVVSDDTTMPCDFPYVISEPDSDVIYQIDLTIDRSGDGYIARLNKMTEIQRVYEPSGSVNN